jgi:hypothetical protein
METFFAILATTGWVGTLLFIGVYHRTATWWVNPYGRALFAMAVSLLIFFTSSMLFNVFGPDYPGRMPFRIISQSLNVATIWYLLIVIVRGGTAARALRRKERVGER